MSLARETELARRETDALLARHETGVISLARADEPYAIPISYGYDAEERRFYLRLVSTPESEKRRFLASEPATRLVVYEEDGDTYESVLATGRLREVTTDQLSVERIEQFGDSKRPLFERWGRGTPELDVRLYELVPEEISGRRVVLDRDVE